MLLALPVQAEQMQISIDELSFIKGCRIGIYRFAEAYGYKMTMEQFDTKLYKECKRQYDYVTMGQDARSKSI